MHSHPLKPRSAWFSVSEAELNPRSERASFPVVTRLVAFPQEANGERSARTPASRSSGVRPKLVASLRMSERCCSTSCCVR
jgi:hypothetical protein